MVISRNRNCSGLYCNDCHTSGQQNLVLIFPSAVSWLYWTLRKAVIFKQQIFVAYRKLVNYCITLLYLQPSITIAFPYIFRKSAHTVVVILYKKLVPYTVGKHNILRFLHFTEYLNRESIMCTVLKIQYPAAGLHPFLCLFRVFLLISLFSFRCLVFLPYLYFFLVKISSL
jgi:hypothetical protein